MTVDMDRLRAEVEELRGAQIVNRNAIRMQRGRREKAEARLAEVEAERDAALAQVVVAYEAAALRASNRWASRMEYADHIAEMDYEHAAIDAKIYGARAEEASALADEIRALTPEAATAALDRLIADRVQAALAAQEEPVAWRLEYASGRVRYTSSAIDMRVSRDQAAAKVKPLYTHPAPASAGVTVKPLAWGHGHKFAEQDCSYAETEFGVWMMVSFAGRAGRWAYYDGSGEISEDDWQTRDECEAAAGGDYERRVRAALADDIREGS